MNKVIKNLILSDIALLSGFGFLTPIFAIFLTDNIQGGNIEVAGFAAAIFWIVHSLVMIPIGKYLDKTKGEHDDLWFIIIGNFLSALAILGFIYSSSPWHIYFLQSAYAVGFGMNLPAYMAIFTRHTDKGKEAFEWGFRSSLVGIGAGVAGAVGGIIANNYGFNALFLIIAAFILASALLPFWILNEIKKGDGEKHEIKKTTEPLAPK